MTPAAGGLRLERLGPQHAGQILAGQDADLAAEIIGAPWTSPALDAFLHRCAAWSADGPIREYAAVEETGAADGEDAVLRGGGGLQRGAAGLERGQAALTYWVLAAQRGRGLGAAVAQALVEQARDDVRISQLVLRIAPENPASRAVARAIGAVRTGVLERHPADASRRADRWTLDVR